jgi:hypothetical protein
MDVQEGVTAEIKSMFITRKNERGEVIGFYRLEDVDGVLRVVEEETDAVD